MGGPNGITFIAWILLAPISIFLTVEVVPEGRLEEYSIWAGYLAGFISHLVTGLMLFFGKFTFFRNNHIKPRPVAMLSWYAVSGAVRGASVAWMFENFGITEHADYLERMRSGAVIILVWFAVSAVMVDGWKSYKSAYQELSNKLEAQKQLRDTGALGLENQINALIEQIRSTLANALFAGASTGDIHNAVDRLVRPLAHRIGESASVKAADAKPVKRRIRFRPVIRTATHDTPYNPGWTVLMAVFGTLSSRIWQFGFLAILDSLAMAFVIWACFRLFRRLKLFSYWVPFMWFATGLAAAAASSLVTTGLVEFNGPLIYMSVNVVVPAAIVASIGAFDRNAKANLDRMAEVISELEWETASLEQRSWVEQKRLARFVHSELQARIRAFALRMDLAARLPNDNEIAELRKECEDSLVTSGGSRDFVTFYQDLVELWQGVCEVELNANPELLVSLQRDPYASVVAIEIIREAVSNAIRHGNSKQIKILMEQGFHPNYSTLEIKVLNDGLPPINPEAGFGLKTIAEIAMSWNLTARESGAELGATIPIH